MAATTLTDVTELRPLNTRKQTATTLTDVMELKLTDVTELKPLSNRTEVGEFIGTSSKQVDLLVIADKFPKPIRVGSHPRWRRSDLLAWLDKQSAQLAATDSQPAG